MAYPPIADHGIIGNLRTVALVCTDGTIDWLCFPHFDSPSVFASVLDDHRGGALRVAPVDPDATSKQLYWPDTNVLVTRFSTRDGVGEVTDFMPVGDHTLIRRVRVTRGAVRFRMTCRPAFDYARSDHTRELAAGQATFRSPQLTLTLLSTVSLAPDDAGGVTCEVLLREGEGAVFAFGDHCSPLERADELLDATIAYWRCWLRKSTYTGRWREMVHRSALVLKLLTFEPTGAIIAAPTCGLPETIGGTRNWDYRYAWIRDAAFTVYGFLRLGFTDEAFRFMAWLDSIVRPGDTTLQTMYGIDGRRELVETELVHLDGYRGSRPVRIGNAAYRQLQLDIYGELLDALYLWNKHVTPIAYDAWTRVRDVIDALAETWRRPDEGIWEVRGGAQHFTYSKMMCWVAFDRALRLADKRSFPADHVRWQRIRDDIYEQIMREAWDPERRTFVQSYGSRALDASALIMPLVFFLAPTDPRMIGTLQAINRSPRQGGLVSDGLVFRYDTEATRDGLTSSEGTFNLCTFWLVEALTRAGHLHPALLDEARLIFERMLTYANHVGLYAEEIGTDGEALGNFPQAFTHLSLISAAFNLDRALVLR